MKKIKKGSIGVLLFAIGILLFSSCTSSDSLKVIPKETNMVSTIDVFSIARKGNLTQLSDFSFFKAFKKEIQNESSKISKIVNDLMKDPTSAGIDLTSELFIFEVSKGDKGNFICFSMEIGSSEKFAEFLKTLAGETGMPLNIEDKVTYKYTDISGEAALAWDDEKVILLTPQGSRNTENLSSTAEELLSLEKKDQITANEKFNKFYKNKKDMNLWVSTDLLKNNVVFRQLGIESMDNIMGNQLSVYLGFEDDKIVMSTQVTLNSTLQKRFDENNIFDNDFNTELLNYFPKQSYIAMSSSINPSAYYKMLVQEESFSQAQKMFEKEMGWSMNEMMESVKGSSVFSLYDFKSDSNLPIPQMGLAFDINGSKMIKEGLSKLPEGTYKDNGTYYEVSALGIYSAYFAFDESTCFITNDKSRIELFKDGGSKDTNLSDSKMASKLSNSAFYAFMNLNYNTYPESIKNLVEQGTGGNQKILKMWTDLMRSVEMRQTDDFTTEMIFTTGDDGQNSLYKIMKTIDENYKSLMAL
ncbi:MAG: DUF4836 family protein [Flavobacteriaceae bacterium]|nr:DUF4836 family protein [Flavobacteriaceae bacterium]